MAAFIAAPCTARFLADLEDEVIRIKAPIGDPLRYYCSCVKEVFRPEGDISDLENAGETYVSLNTKSGRKRL